jgi:hypothetical protein
LSSPLRARQGDDEFVRYTPPTEALPRVISSALRPGAFVSAARADVVWEHAQPQTPCVRLLKPRIDDFAQEHPAPAAARTRNRNPLEQRDAFRRVSIAQNRESNGLCAISRNGIGMPAIGNGAAVTCVIPTADADPGKRCIAMMKGIIDSSPSTTASVLETCRLCAWFGGFFRGPSGVPLLRVISTRLAAQ